MVVDRLHKVYTGRSSCANDARARVGSGLGAGSDDGRTVRLGIYECCEPEVSVLSVADRSPNALLG